MKIEGKDVESFSRLLNEGQQQGYRYVSILNESRDDYTRLESVQFYREKTEALNYGFLKRSSEGHIIDAVPIPPLKEQLYRKADLQDLSDRTVRDFTDVLVDIELIKFQEKARAEIFIEDIARILKAHNLHLDHRALQKNIEDDRISFQIVAMRREYDLDKHYVVRIEQNSSRSFSIQSMQEKEIAIQYIKSDGLQIPLIKDEAKQILDLLQKHIENGNRFLAFPSRTVLSKEDFSVFRSAVGALEHAQTYGTAKDPYIVRSVVAIETEIRKLVEANAEKDLFGKMNVKTYQRSGDRDLSL